MSPEAIMELIDVATKLAGVINAEVQASDSEEVKAAWKQAQNMFTEGYDEAYGH